MGAYLAARAIAWDRQRFLASWQAFENLLVVADADVVGLLRLLPEQDGLGLRDLQVVPQCQGRGIGTWAVQQAQAIAAGRGVRRLQLRVYEENPARDLYARLGFRTERIDGGTVHMAWDVPSPHDHPAADCGPVTGAPHAH
jgi:ribosomal protein S18 acetylase RimI-like enzyme